MKKRKKPQKSQKCVSSKNIFIFNKKKKKKHVCDLPLYKTFFFTRKKLNFCMKKRKKRPKFDFHPPTPFEAFLLAIFTPQKIFRWKTSKKTGRVRLNLVTVRVRRGETLSPLRFRRKFISKGD